MDVGMPVMNGYDATRAIRERPWGREVTILALTGWGQEADRAESKRAGCDGHLVKPIHLEALEPFLSLTRKPL
jgi:two-component system CheB/CheR fusion protein